MKLKLRTCLLLLILFFSVGLSRETAGAQTSKSATEVTKELQIGWNLGNQFDCWNPDKNATVTETSWGSPTVTKELIHEVKKAGFQAIRIPVTYYNHMDANDQIDSAWLKRVGEVTQWVLDENMYCIINVHHDTGSAGWLTADAATVDANTKRLSVMWEQIAHYFKNYDEKLIFEGYNEILNLQKKWNYAGESSYDAANRLNQTFVNTVRATGGNNATRFLKVNTYAASSAKEVMKHFVLPTDTVRDRLFVGINCYNGAGVPETFADIDACFTQKGIPVIISEFGRTNTNNEPARKAYVTQYLTFAQKYHIPCFWWDDSQTCASASWVRNYALMNRRTVTWYFPDLVQTLVSFAKNHTQDQPSDTANAGSNTLKPSSEPSQTPEAPSTDAASDKNTISVKPLRAASLSKASNWKSGNYTESAAAYRTRSSRYCTKDLYTCNGGEKLTYQNKDKSCRLAIRQLNKTKQVIQSSNLSSGKCIKLKKGTSYVVFVLYHRDDSGKKEHFKTIFAKDKISFTLKKA